MSVERRRSGQEVYTHDRIKKIVDEFYTSQRANVPLEDEAEKARILLAYIEHLKAKYAKNNNPMGERDIAALGFDIEELKKGRIRAAK